MQDHNWLLEVCQDLIDYAMNNEMHHLEDQLQSAVVAAQHDILLAALDTHQERTNNVVILAHNIGF